MGGECVVRGEHGGGGGGRSNFRACDGHEGAGDRVRGRWIYQRYRAAPHWGRGGGGVALKKDADRLQGQDEGGQERSGVGSGGGRRREGVDGATID